MDSLQFHTCFNTFSPKLPRFPLRNPILHRRLYSPFFKKLNDQGFGGKIGSRSCFCKANTQLEKSSEVEDEGRPPFDVNLAVILAGFSFEAYNTPPENYGRKEVDAADCKTVFLSESFVREIYDGLLFIKLKKGFKFPAMDPWGTSDPYVVMQLDGQVFKSKVKWGTKEPTWNEDFTFNIKQPYSRSLQIAAWDANLVTPHKRMGNSGISLEGLCDGSIHEVLVDLEGMGGGGKIELEVKYKSFEEIEEEKKWWRIPLISEFLRRNGFESLLKTFVGSDTVPARQFVEYAFGQLRSCNDASLLKNRLLGDGKGDAESVAESSTSLLVSDQPSQTSGNSKADLNDEQHTDNDGESNGFPPESVMQDDEMVQSDKQYWKKFTYLISQSVVQKLGLPVPEKFKWDAFDLLNRIGLQSQEIAEAGYVESGLAAPRGRDVKNDEESGSHSSSIIQTTLPDIKKATQDLLRQTDSVLGALMVLTAAVPQLNKEKLLKGKIEIKAESPTKLEGSVSGYLRSEKPPGMMDDSVEDEKMAEEMKELFLTAESAMEAWAMLATSIGHPSFIKSEFEKICFLDNETTDTQVAIWRDLDRKRIIIAFRGTEQAKWKDLRTDLMLVPAGLNPERIGGDFKQEIQVHSGFLSAYDSVRIRILSLIKLSISYLDEVAEPRHKWRVYVTGHSLGGALATLLALELASSQLAKSGAISVTMYNFGSPRVGNKRFAEVYNEKVKDSWRVVNHRDIIPTVPRLMGYCHVAQPIYLAPGDLCDTLENMELLKDGYHGDVIGEATPDDLVSEFMKGEKELIEKILQTEINIFRAIRDGSALMQHMEDFYYITLLESVRSNYQNGASSQNSEQDSMSV